MLSNIIMGFTTALSPANLIAVLGGTILGICFGAMPGLSATNIGRFSGSSGYVNCDQANLYCLNRYLHCIAGCSDLQ